MQLLTMPIADTIEREIVTRLAESEPAVEVLLCEFSGGTVRIFIDHPEGVSLELCERVTHALRPVRESYALEVSSPGPKRPLTKPEHFARFSGQRVKLRSASDHDGRRNFTGEIVEATADGVTLGVDGALVTLAWNDVERANLVPDSVPTGNAPTTDKTE